LEKRKGFVYRALGKYERRCGGERRDTTTGHGEKKVDQKKKGGSFAWLTTLSGAAIVETACRSYQTVMIYGQMEST